MSCWKLHFSPRGHEPEYINLKHSLLPSPDPDLCRLWETSYLQYCESDTLALDLFVTSSRAVLSTTNVYGDKVVFGGFMLISAADIVDAGVGEMARIYVWEKQCRNQQLKNAQKIILNRVG